MSRDEDVRRITAALEEAAEVASRYDPAKVEVETKDGGSPLTAADLAVNEVLERVLPREGEGWLSEETKDDKTRLDCRRTWIVDPIDGTREFVMGLPEWCISIGLIEDGVPVAGGIVNPAAGHTVIGSLEDGVTHNGNKVASLSQPLDGARVLASRSETERGEWDEWKDAPFSYEPMGSVAYKLALTAAGLCDATWTLVPKNEWDVAGGAALVRAAGGCVVLPNGETTRFNREDPLLPGFMAVPDPEQVAGWKEFLAGIAARGWD